MANEQNLTLYDHYSELAVFNTTRNEKLHRWHAESQSPDHNVKVTAQARLQLQFRLREERYEAQELASKCDQLMDTGNDGEVVAARNKLEELYASLASLEQAVLNRVTDNSVRKWAKKWTRASHSLVDILSQEDFDRLEDFTAPDWPSIAPEPVSYVVQKVDPEARNAHDFEAQLVQQHGNIWHRHKALMIAAYEEAGIKEHIWKTKLFVSGKVFEDQADTEIHVHRTYLSTPEQSDRLRSGLTVTKSAQSENFVVSEHTVWELSSTMLWHGFEGGHSWLRPGWVPSGHLRIQTVFGVSTISFDIVGRAYIAERARVPAAATTQVYYYVVTCEQTGTAFQVEIVFLEESCILVRFPVLTLVQQDPGCHFIPDQYDLIEFSGVSMGAAD